MTEEFCTLSWPEESIALITLNRPDKLNAINVEMLQQWREILEQLEDSSKAPRCLLVTGAGRAFSSGADIRATMKVAKEHNGDLGSILSAYYNPLILAIQKLPFPVISVVNGLAVGVGFSFALHADIIIASEDAYFWANFAEIGLVPDGAMSFMLPRFMGYHTAAAHILLAEKMTAIEAKSCGLVYQLYGKDILMRKAIELAMRMSQHSKVANQETKSLLREGMDRTFKEQIQAESISQARAGYSDEAKKAIMNFIIHGNKQKGR
ncbi:MAG: enoyl-CoA hydratase-related protein [Pseudomonadota bacterium]|nr:enoyl-CoA hydratase-related protein [Pseudomonadota bacterium]